AHLQQPRHVRLPAGLPAPAIRSRLSQARSRARLALVAAFGIVVLAGFLFATAREAWLGGLPPGNDQGGVERGPFPIGMHRGGKTHSVKAVHDDVDLHYAFYFPGEFGTASRSSQNSRTLAWRDAGSISLGGGKTFGYDRDGADPFHLRVNGKEYDLRQGRVLALSSDGSVLQLKIFPSLSTTETPDELAKLVASAQWMDVEPLTAEKLRAQLDAAEAQLHDLLKTH